MESIIFTINSEKVLTIGDLLQSDIFECISVAAKDAQNTPSANSKISFFQFGEHNGIGLDPDPVTGNGFIKSDEFLTPEYNVVKPNNEGLILTVMKFLLG